MKAAAPGMQAKKQHGGGKKRGRNEGEANKIEWTTRERKRRGYYRGSWADAGQNNGFNTVEKDQRVSPSTGGSGKKGKKKAEQIERVPLADRNLTQRDVGGSERV